MIIYTVAFMDKDMGVLNEVDLHAINLSKAMYTLLANLEEWPVGTEQITINLPELEENG